MTSLTKSSSQETSTLQKEKVPSPSSLKYRQLGSTGEIISILGLGGFHIGVPKDEDESIRIIRTAIDAGVTFLDNSWDYHDGDATAKHPEWIG